MGLTWHAHHFTCEGCAKPLAGTSFVKRDGRPYCKDCNAKFKSQGKCEWARGGGASERAMSYNLLSFRRTPTTTTITTTTTTPSYSIGQSHWALALVALVALWRFARGASNRLVWGSWCW